MTEDKISELEDIKVEVLQSDNRKKKAKKNGENLGMSGEITKKPTFAS